MYSSYSTTSFTPPKDTTPGQGVPCQLTSHLSSVFGNADVVSVDQDPLDQAGHVVSSATGQLILAKPLANGDVSVVLFNEDTTAPATMSTTASAVGLPSAPAYTLQDLWSKSAVQTTGAISETVPAGGVVMLRVAPASVDTDCSSLTSGSTVGGNLKIPAGSFCQLNGVTVNGNVNVGAGGYLSATGGHIAGSVISQGGDVLLASTSVGGNVTSQQSAVQLRGADVTGNVQLSQATGEAVVCGTTVGGNLEVQNAAAHTDLCSNSVTGNLTVRNNNGPVWVTDNTTTANLQCSNDSPEAISNGNSVGAQELGECTH
jgi:hypothetical protein